MCVCVESIHYMSHYDLLCVFFPPSLTVLAEVHDCDDEVLYEPAVDAILKLSMFIGDKKYSQDFLSGERR